MTASRNFLSSIALLVALLGGTTTLGGCATNSVSAPLITTPQLESVMRVCDSGTPNCTGGTGFSVGSLRDLQVNVDWSNMPGGTHTQEITFLLPNGVVYQTVSRGFGVAETLGSLTVGDAMPVAGTFITQRQLTGQWTVQVSLDGAVVGSQKIQLDP